jgi:hypothetical protein
MKRALRKLRLRHLPLLVPIGLLAMVLTGCQEESVSYCNKVVPAHGYCTSDSTHNGSVVGLIEDNTVSYYGESPLPVCAYIDIYNRSSGNFVKRLSNCVGGELGGTAERALSTSERQAYFNDKYFMVALAYNGSGNAHTLHAAAYGYILK